MAANAINGMYQGANSHNVGYGVLGIATSTQGPLLDRYHSSGDDQGWKKSGKGHKKNSLALSALTLLAFLFFLHILQSCLDDHMYDKHGKDRHRFPHRFTYYQNFTNLIPQLPFLPLPANPGIITASGRAEEGINEKDEEYTDLPAANSLEIDNLTFQQPQDRVSTGHSKNKKKRKNPNKRTTQNQNPFEKVKTINN